jgi:hypothetical protein
MAANGRPMVLVTWVDAKFCQGTHSEQDILAHRMSMFESLGYLISQDKLTTVLACERNNDGEYRDITLIPTGSIQSIVYLRKRGKK